MEQVSFRVVELSLAFYQSFTANARVTALSHAVSRRPQFHNFFLHINSID